MTYRKENVKLKGKAVVAQSGGCTAVINQSLAGVVEGARRAKEITHVWGSCHGVTGLLKGDLLDLKAQPRAMMNSIRQLPSAALGSSRHKLSEEEEVRILKNLKKWSVRYLLMIGGNDTAETILQIVKAAEKDDYELRAIHIPKTIDNDLMETDHCPGYGSVARFAAIATQEAALDTQAMRHVDPVKIIELMGRNSGWIVAASALLKKSEADAPHLLLLPEVPFEEAAFLSRVEKILEKQKHCILVISETIRDKSGKRLGVRSDGITHDPFGHQYVEGAAHFLAHLIESNLMVRARYDKPGTIQRMSIPYISHVDQQEAYQAGLNAVKFALKGFSKVMVSFAREVDSQYKIRYDAVNLEKIPGRERYLPASFLNADKTMITKSFSDYALPLIGEQLPQFPHLKSLRPRV